MFKQFLIFLLCTMSTASIAFAQDFEFKTGDILLQPLSCWSCQLIQAQEKSDYAHIGIVVNINQQLMVAEAYGKVRLVPLSQFLSKTSKEAKVRVRRLNYEFIDFDIFEKDLIKSLMSYIGLSYDPYFLWDNTEKNKELIYCSELVYKSFNKVIKLVQTRPKEMLFDVNALEWDRFFRGETPRGKMGISPEDFNLSQDFYTVYEI